MKTPPQSSRAIVALYQECLYREAVELADLALEESPHDGKLWELHGMAHEALGHQQQAIASLETATTLVPLSPAGQCLLAKCYSAAGHRELARDMYRYLFALASLPDRLLPVVAAGLGSLGEYNLALEACRRAADRDLDSGQPLYGMAHYMERLDYPLEMVVGVLRRAVAIEPDKFQFRFALAMACQQMGNIEEAHRVLRGVVGAEQLRCIRCANCIRRLDSIFVAAGDLAQSAACRRRLDELDS